MLLGRQLNSTRFFVAVNNGPQEALRNSLFAELT
jgi:hypothetical protein